MKKQLNKTNLIVGGTNRHRTRAMNLAALLCLTFSTESFAEAPIWSSLDSSNTASETVQQNKKAIQGVVTDVKGEPLIGVNIIVNRYSYKAGKTVRMCLF